ncbi:NAD/NADP-dependent octopine/nopaline dehydrogenase family protein [Agrobacterium larrymoorei]|uniref:D-nopaline dehydrogenase n=1 Tax=Agrobacterium larrymoorei TaxID=160699 RepID=A0A4D7DXJ5_9HYPH|nr:NAD/NADP-dependent octopine/nopaline dehydrogenase family protein [Agrobacterium larrymoorei]QCJ01009.1 D-nopaline dehydrogenase [Agrobacterium larrymoorei]QYA10345.1 NAD/NADP octopine/nopaline dehydrogenase family protein [Agrobacterium larrymoorei]
MDFSSSTCAPLSVLILGAGHVGTALAAWFTFRSIAVSLWAPLEHRGYLKDFSDACVRIRTSGLLNGDYFVPVQESLASAVAKATLLIIATRADAHPDLVRRFQLIGESLSAKEVLVVCGRGFAIKYAGALSFKRILETDNSPVTSKLTGDHLSVVQIKEFKKVFGASCYPIYLGENSRACLPSDVICMLNQLFPFSVKAILPLETALFSNYITHAVSAVLNIGRLPDDCKLSEKAKSWRRNPEKGGNGFPYYFYGEGSNSVVCRVQEAVDRERLEIGRAYGIVLRPILAESNEEYGTDYPSLREYCLAPSPHNVNFACPDSIQHRYYMEELSNIELIISLANAVGVRVPLTEGVALIIRSAGGLGERTLTDLKAEDAVKFGGNCQK